MISYRILAFLALLSLSLPLASAAIVTKIVDYTDAKGTLLQGILAYDDSITGKRPGILVIHDWRGVTENTEGHCKQLAELGYVAFAADIYGKGVRPKNIPGYIQQATIYKTDRPLFRERARAAYDTLLKQPGVDPKRVAAIGYCFGGTGVIEMARDGVPLLGVVSFHGGLDNSPLSPGSNFTAKVLALCGAEDPFEKPADMAAFEQQLKDLHVDYQIIQYSSAEHSFTDEGVDALNLPGAKYNAAASRRSWQAMKDFFAELFQAAPSN